MKKIVIISVFIFIFTFLFINSTYPHQNEILLGDARPGDINSDGKVNSLDYIIIRKYLMNQTTLTNNQKILSDVNGDGKVSSMDYVLIRKSIINGTNIEVKETSIPTKTATPKPTPTPSSKPTAAPTARATPTPTPRPTATPKPTPTPTPKPTATPTYTCKLTYDKMSNQLKITGTASNGTKIATTTINGVSATAHRPTYDGKYSGKVFFSNGKTCEDSINVTRLKILFFGDSITAGINNTGASWYSWADYIGDTYHFNVRKAGYPGYFISDYYYTLTKEGRWIIWYVWQDLNVPGGTNMGDYVKGKITGGYNSNGTAKIQYDYVILHGGINDININTPLGTSNNNDKSGNYQFDTFLGGLDRYVYLAKQYWPNAKIGYIVNFQTPNHPGHVNDRDAFNNKTQNYFNAMKNTLKNKWNMPYLDLYNGKASNGQAYSSIILPYLYDGLHPTKDGHKIIGGYVYNWMKTL